MSLEDPIVVRVYDELSAMHICSFVHFSFSFLLFMLHDFVMQNNSEWMKLFVTKKFHLAALFTLMQ